MKQEEFEEIVIRHLGEDFRSHTIFGDIVDECLLELKQKCVVIGTPQPGEKERKCNWCGGKKNDKGGLLDITIHNECYEGIMNGAGII